DCRLSLRRSVVRDNDAGGLILRGGSIFTLENLLVTDNGRGTGATSGGVHIDGATGTLEFSTVTGNRIMVGTRAAGIACIGDLLLGNNVVLGNRLDAGTSADVGGGCRHAYSVIGAGLDLAQDAGDNLAEDPLLDPDTGR